MRISSSDVQLASQYTAVSRLVRKESVEERVWQVEEEPSGRSNSQAGAEAGRPTVNLGRVDRFERQGSLVEQVAQNAQVQRSSKAKKTDAATGADSGAGIAETDLELSAEDKARIEMIVAMIERISGKKITLVDPEKALKKAYETPDVDTLSAVQAMKAQATPQETTEADVQPTRMREVRYHLEESYYEAEATTFEATGVVKTADGQEINFGVSLSMSREFAHHLKMDTVTQEVVKDPLVINFGGTAAELTQRQYDFDIDMDGTSDQIHFVGSGSGFLALDNNGDGTVNDGGELFGARTGDGFGELAQYDDDRNGWIDEGDAVYDRLQIWSKDAEGNDSLVALGQRGIGAIYLGHVDTPFQVKDAANQLQGIVRSSGVYLNESGSVGTVQKVDLVV